MEKRWSLANSKIYNIYIIQTKTNNVGPMWKYELFVCLFHIGPDELFAQHCQI